MHRSLPTLLFLALLLSACGQRAYRARLDVDVAPDHLSAAAVSADLDYLHAAVERIAPLPYLTTDTARVDAAYARVRGRGAQSPLQFYEGILGILASYDASHYFVRLPAGVYLEEIRKTGHGVLPFRAVLTDRGLLITQTFRGFDKDYRGAIVHRINGYAADSLFRDYYRYVGGVEPWKHEQVHDDFHELLYLNGIHGPFTLEISAPLFGRNAIVTHPGYTYPRRESKEGEPPREVTPRERLARAVDFQMIDRTGYLRLSKLSGYDYGLYREFLDSTFRAVQTLKPERIVVDLRGNGGGNSRLGDWLLDYLTDKPYRTFGGSYFKVSPEANRNFRYGRANPWLLRQIPYGPGIRLAFRRHPAERNLYVMQPRKRLRNPRANPLRYAGPVYYVIDNGTYSSATALANAVEDYDLGTLIGQPTGNAPTEPGEVVKIVLPHSKHIVSLPSAYFIRASGDADNLEPTQPDVPVYREILRRMEPADIVRTIDGLTPQTTQ